jgi:ribosomal protein S18 acetylase RimI-like enzyme
VGDATPDELLAPLIERLSQAGITFIQSGCDDDSQGKLLTAGGFEPLADLVMMSLEAEKFCNASEATGCDIAGQSMSDPVTWVEMEQLGEDWRMHLNDVTAQTFIDTRDCLRLSDFRSANDIVQGYVEAKHFDPRLASLMRVGDQWAGCLILTAHPAEAGANGSGGDDAAPPAESGAIELTYMGLVPQYRGKRLAGHLLAKVVQHATTSEAARIVLAVDRDNHPAATIYRRLGWRDVIAETVWGRKI